MEPIVLHVTGMTCQGCVSSVKRVVAAQTGVEPDVVLESGEVRIPPAANREDAVQAIRKAGFEVDEA